MHESAALRSCVAAVAVLWFVNGAISLSIGPRLPEIAEQLGLGYGALAAALLGQTLGLIIAMLPAAWLAGRVSPAKVGVGAAVAFAASSALPGIAESQWQLFLFLGLVGVTNAPLDVANPTLGSELGRRRGKTTMTLLESSFTVGAAVGGLVGSLAATRVPVAWHLAGVAAVGVSLAALSGLVLAVNYRHLPEGAPELAPRRDGPAGRRPVPGLVLLTWLAIVGAAALGSEAAAQDWLAFLFRDLGAPPTQYALGYGAFITALFIAQLFGGHIADRRGAATVVRVGAALFAVGMVAAVVSGSVPLAVAGLAIAGLGLGNVHPLALDAAGRVRPVARSMAVVNIISYVGIAASRPAVGKLAELTSLRSALGVCAVALGLVMCVGAWATMRPVWQPRRAMGPDQPRRRAMGPDHPRRRAPGRHARRHRKHTARRDSGSEWFWTRFEQTEPSKCPDPGQEAH
jgi:MFS family permease